MSKQTIPIVITGKMPHEHLEDGHPDLRGARGLARDAGISVEDAQRAIDECRRCEWIDEEKK